MQSSHLISYTLVFDPSSESRVNQTCWNPLTRGSYQEKVDLLSLRCLKSVDDSNGRIYATCDKEPKKLSERKVFQIDRFKLRMDFHQHVWTLRCEDTRNRSECHFLVGELFKNCLRMPLLDLTIVDVYLDNSTLFAWVKRPVKSWRGVNRPGHDRYTLVGFPLRTSTHIMDLPADPMHLIFDKLPNRDWRACRAVCRTWQKLLQGKIHQSRLDYRALDYFSRDDHEYKFADR